MYLRRKADSFLREWKNRSDRFPLIVSGARQIGKTETIRKFANENYESFAEINFVTEPKYKTIIEDGCLLYQKTLFQSSRHCWLHTMKDEMSLQSRNS